MSGEESILNVETFRENDWWADLALNEEEKEKVLANRNRPYISGQLNTTRMNDIVQIFTADIYDFSIKMADDASMYSLAHTDAEATTVAEGPKSGIARAFGTSIDYVKSIPGKLGDTYTFLGESDKYFDYSKEDKEKWKKGAAFGIQRGGAYNIYRGIENTSVSCYYNSVLQMIYHIPEFKDLILAQVDITPALSSGLDKDTYIFRRAVKTFFELMEDGEPFTYVNIDLTNPKNKEAKEILDVAPGQQDAGEFLFKIFKIKRDDADFITSTMIRQIICDNGTKGDIGEEIVSTHSISLDSKIPENIQEGFNTYYTNKNRVEYRGCGVLDASGNNGSNGYIPEESAISKYIIIYLKRFQIDTSKPIETRYKEGRKISDPILANTVLNIKDREGEKRYILRGCVYHGGGVGGGHYTYWWNDGKDWVNFNDTRVSKGGPAKTEIDAGYIYLYEQSTETPPTLEDTDPIILIRPADLSIKPKIARGKITSTGTELEEEVEEVEPENPIFLNKRPSDVKKKPAAYKTLTDFNREYLGWISPSEANAKQRKRDVKNVFKFIFGIHTINDVSTSYAKKKMRIAHTPLTVDDKLPCGGKIFEDFLASLKFRKTHVDKEVSISEEVVGGNYVRQKKLLQKGLLDLINVLESNVARSCISYSYGDSKDYMNIMDDFEQNRIMRVFLTFVDDYKNKPTTSKDGLKRDIRDKKGTHLKYPDTGYDELYTNLVSSLGALKDTHKKDADKFKNAMMLLEISMAITKFNEEYIGLKSEFEKAKMKAQGRELERMYALYKETVDDLKLIPPVLGVVDPVTRQITLSEEIADILVLYSGGKDICEGANYANVKAQLTGIKAQIEAMDHAGTAEQRVKILRIIGVAEKLIERKHAECVAPAPTKGGGSAEKASNSRIENRVKHLFQLSSRPSQETTKLYCDTMLSILIIDVKRRMKSPGFSATNFLNRFRNIVKNTEECENALEVLKRVVDEITQKEIKKDAYVFYPARPYPCLESLEQMYSMVFTDDEKEILEQTTRPITYYSHAPTEYEDIMSKSSYFLTGDKTGKHVRIYGIADEYEHAPLYVTPTELRLMKKGGIPLTAILFMYLTALRTSLSKNS